MSRFVRSTRCRTSESRSYRWIAVLTIFAMLGFAGFALADTGAHHGTKLVPNSETSSNLTGKNVAEAPIVKRTVPVGGHDANAALSIPANDDCSGAIAIPPAGPFPYTTAPVDVTDATPQDVDEGLSSTCVTAGFTMDRSIWYTFTPAVDGLYTFNTCLTVAAGSTLFDSVITILDSTGGSCPEGTSFGCNDSGGCSCASGCGGPAGAPYTDQAKLGQFMTAGHTYFIVAGDFTGAFSGAPFQNIAINVTFASPPPNDTCSAPTPLTLDRITFGTTAGATNDYRSANSCFTGVGQILTSSNGLDAVFSFTPATTQAYTFRYVQDDSGAALRGQSPSLYLSTVCPAPNNAVAVPACIAGANRMNDQTTGNGNRSEEIKCVPLIAGTPYFLFFDDRFTGNAGGDLALEVVACNNETEPNDTTATATVYNGGSGGFMNGSSITSGPAADIDFYDLGAPPAGSKIFVGVDAAASNESDYELRITTTTDTLGYNDNDGTSWIGSEAPIVGGVFATGGEIYARINSKTVTPGNEPYRIYTRIETGVAQNEDLPDHTPDGLLQFNTANHITGGGFVKGIMSTTDDMDCFQFVAHTGDQLSYFSDNNPSRGGGTITNVWPSLATTDRLTPSNTVFFGQVLINNVSPSPGTLTGTSPSVTSEFSNFRARYTGAYLACFTPTSDVTSGNVAPPAAAYPLPWQGSISVNGGPVAAPDAADLSITKTGPAGPLETGTIFDYTITITNNDATGVAQTVVLSDTLDPNLNFLSLGVIDGFGGRATTCTNLPTPGQNDDSVACSVAAVTPGQTITFFLTAQVANCIGAGIQIDNTASISSYTLDSNSSNDSASWSFTTAQDPAPGAPEGGCIDLLCDPNAGCIPNECTINNRCESGVCQFDTLNCDDSSVCTDDSCDPSNAVHPCVNDDSNLGALCFDGNDCTLDTCDPITFCQFPASPAGGACDDFLNCTNSDTCNGAGGCVGISVCDDGLPCTDDFADENNACACDNPLSFPGTPCDDGNACTTGTTCDGTDGTAASCNGGGTVGCDDGNPCTDDSCDTVLGCVHTNNSNACDDGSACTDHDTCGGGTCNGGSAHVCNDGNACTDDTCDSGTGCVFTNNSASCDDGNACTTGDTCGGGTCNGGGPLACNDGNACNGVETCNPGSGCVPGVALVCNDGNACTDDSCNPGSGCVYTNNTNACDDGNACTTVDACSGGSCVGSVPVVCSAADQCHVVGVCSPGTGTCSNPNQPDGTTCNDGNPGTANDACQGGTCVGGSSCNSSNDPKTHGWYHSLCTSGGHSGDSITNADAACVSAMTSTFAGVHTAADVCDVLDPSHHNNSTCSKAEDELMALALNICKQRLCPSQGIDGSCTGASTVGGALHNADVLLANANRSNNDCSQADCTAQDVNTGHGLEFDTLSLRREGGNVRLNWIAPTLDNGSGTPSSYKIWRRPMGSMVPFVQIGTTTGTTFLDQTAGTAAWQYDLTSVN